MKEVRHGAFAAQSSAHWYSAPFSYLQLLRKCILQMTRPVVEGSLGSPPFEKPNIEQVGWGMW